MEVHRLINEQRFQDAAREALELAVMGREDPKELAIQAIHAPSWVPIKARPQIKARPKIRTWPPLPRIPHPNAARVFPKPSTQGYTYLSGPTPATWGRTRSTRGPAADQVQQQPAAPAQAPACPEPRHWARSSIDALLPCSAQGPSCRRAAPALRSSCASCTCCWLSSTCSEARLVEAHARPEEALMRHLSDTRSGYK